MPALSQTLKADRAAMAAYLAEVADQYGAVAVIEPERDRVLYVGIQAPGGLAAWIDFDPTIADNWCVAWCMASGSTNRLRLDFANHGDVNPHHQRKATLFARDFDGMVKIVRAGLAKAADGTAYTTVQEIEARRAAH